MAETTKEVLTEAQWWAWYREQMKLGWQENIDIPAFKFDEEHECLIKL